MPAKSWWLLRVGHPESLHPPLSSSPISLLPQLHTHNINIIHTYMSDLHPLTHHHQQQQEIVEIAAEQEDQQQEEVDDDKDDVAKEKSQALEDLSGDNKVQSNSKAKQLLNRVKRYKEKKLKKYKALDPTVAAPPFPYAYCDYYDREFGPSGCCACCFNLTSENPGRSAKTESKDSKKPVLCSSAIYDGFVKSLIEENDFYSRDCNVHQDIDSG